MNILILILLPVLAGVLLHGLPRASGRILGLGAAIAGLFLTAFFLYVGESSTYSLDWFAPLGLKLSFGMDKIAGLMLLLLHLVMVIVMSMDYQEDEKRSRLYSTMMCLAMAALAGVFLAQNPLSFYLFFELALIPIFVLAGSWGTDDRSRVTIKFLVYTVTGSLMLLAAIIYLYTQSGSDIYSWSDLNEISLSAKTQMWLCIGFFLAFAIKSPIFPFHSWQADLYESTTTPVTIILAALMSKLGLLGIIRFILPLCGDFIEAYGMIFILLGVIAVSYGALIAITRDHVKRLLAFSSLSHIGLIAAGLFTLNLWGWQGGLFQMFVHGINIAGLFLCGLSHPKILWQTLFIDDGWTCTP